MKVERIKEFLKLLSMQQKKIVKYLSDYSLTQERVLTLHKGQRVTNWVKKANIALRQHYNNFFEKVGQLTPMKKKNVEMQTTPPLRDIITSTTSGGIGTGNWMTVSSPIVLDKRYKGESLFNPTSLIKQKPMGTASNLSELLLTNESLPIFPPQQSSYTNSHIPVLRENKQYTNSCNGTNFQNLPNYMYNTTNGQPGGGGCCCYKDKLIADQQSEIIRLQDQMRERDIQHKQEMSKIKSKLRMSRTTETHMREQYSSGIRQLRNKVSLTSNGGGKLDELNRLLQRLLEETTTLTTARENETFTDEEDINVNLHDDLLSFRLKITK
jgi:hypothetical protein